jgi:hypothetical protein
MKLRTALQTYTTLAALALAGLTCTPAPLRAADHGDAPIVAGDQGADLADLYAFQDPNDNSRTVIIVTLRGFITAGEAVNFGIFDPTVNHRIEIESTGDAKPDKFIDITFSPRSADPGPMGKEILQVPKAQTATLKFTGFKDSSGAKVKGTFTAPATNPALGPTAPTQVVTDLTVGADTVQFFAGETDDPFFFDIPGFARFIASVRNGMPDPTQLNRGRDSFAGYNVMAIAVSLPSAMLKGTGNVVGISAATQRKQVQKLGTKGKLNKGSGSFKNVDREGVPGVNVALVPFNRKNEYNQASPKDDAALKFGADILATLAALGTNGATNFPPTDNALTLAQVAVLNGDILRLDTSIANTGNHGGDNAPAGFPNGRRLKDDVIDIILSLVANGNPFDGIDLGDNVNGNDVDVDNTNMTPDPFKNVFPFLAPSQQPLPTGTTDDGTRN